MDFGEDSNIILIHCWASVLSSFWEASLGPWLWEKSEAFGVFELKWAWVFSNLWFWCWARLREPCPFLLFQWNRESFPFSFLKFPLLFNWLLLLWIIQRTHALCFIETPILLAHSYFKPKVSVSETEITEPFIQWCSLQSKLSGVSLECQGFWSLQARVLEEITIEGFQRF